jgi:hypothetical protein
MGLNQVLWLEKNGKPKSDVPDYYGYTKNIVSWREAYIIDNYFITYAHDQTPKGLIIFRKDLYSLVDILYNIIISTDPVNISDKFFNIKHDDKLYQDNNKEYFMELAESYFSLIKFIQDIEEDDLIYYMSDAVI